MSATKSLTYLIVSPSKKISFSLSKETSDSFNNQSILNNVIGTLVKYDTNGNIRPYLAEKWTVSADKQNWVFELREGIKCENGEPITAESFVDNLSNSLLSYSKKSNLMVFDKLKGFDHFVSGKSSYIEGLFAKENKIIFDFKFPSNGLLEFLRMAYFGYWCEYSGKLYSSASYSVDSFSTDFIKLKKRTDWFSSDDIYFESILIKSASSVDSITKEEHALIKLNSLESIDHVDSKFRSIKGLPTILTSLVFSTQKMNEIGVSIELKKELGADIKQRYASNMSANSSLSIADSFYSNSRPLNFVKVLTQKIVNDYKGSIKVGLLNRFSVSELKRIEEVIKESVNLYFPNASIEFSIVSIGDDNWREKILSDDYFHLRIVTVDTGATFINPAIEMMFCSEMGVNFPDENNEVCSLIEKEREENNFPYYMTEDSREEFLSSLERLGNVIPLSHTGIQWFSTKSLSLNSIPSGSNHPLFEAVKLEE